jgi:hypothetical protein
MKREEIELKNNRKMIIEVFEKDDVETIKTGFLDKDGNLEGNGWYITCGCENQSVTQFCANDGYCTCYGGVPRVVCT